MLASFLTNMALTNWLLPLDLNGSLQSLYPAPTTNQTQYLVMQHFLKGSYSYYLDLIFSSPALTFFLLTLFLSSLVHYLFS
jgi:hypothetical protein